MMKNPQYELLRKSTWEICREQYDVEHMFSRSLQNKNIYKVCAKKKDLAVEMDEEET